MSAWLDRAADASALDPRPRRSTATAPTMPERSPDVRSRRSWARLGLAALFAGSGGLHLVRPDLYLPLMPDILPAHEALILISGAAELLCAAGLVVNARWAAPASVALLVAILPGNIHFALAASADAHAPAWLVVIAWLRLPLQLPLIWAALQDRPAPRRVQRPARPRTTRQ